MKANINNLCIKTDHTQYGVYSSMVVWNNFRHECGKLKLMVHYN